MERRSRAEKGETNLKISRGKIVTTRKYNQRKDVSALSERGAALTSSPSASEIKKKNSIITFVYMLHRCATRVVCFLLLRNLDSLNKLWSKDSLCFQIIV